MTCEHKWIPVKWIYDVKDTVDLEIQCKKCGEVKILESCRAIGYKEDPDYKDPPGIQTTEVKWWKVEYD